MSEGSGDQGGWEGGRYRQARPRPKKRRAGLGALGGVVLALLFLGGVRALLNNALTIGPSTPPTTIGETFDREMAAAPALAPMREEMQRDYPALYGQMRQTFIDRIRAGDDKLKAMGASLHIAAEYGRAHSGVIPLAPEATLQALVTQNAASMNIFRSAGDEVCGRFVVTGGVEGGTPDQVLAVTQRNAALMHAIHGGETAPVQRAPVNAGDLAIFRSALVSRGLTPSQIGVVFKGGLDKMPAADQCRTGSVVYDVLASMPTEVGVKLTAVLAASGA
jgi:hypothetical protein